jgi:ureidoglycolate lyase
MEGFAMKIKTQNLTSATFAPFGELIEQPGRDPDGSGPGWSWWGGAALLAGDDRPFEIGYLDLNPAELRFDWAERHMRSPELLVPVEADILVYVGPPDYPDEPARLPSHERFQVFRVRPGQAALLNAGVWHGAPLAVDQPARVVVLLLKDSGKIDGYVARFPEQPIEIEI